MGQQPSNTLAAHCGCVSADEPCTSPAHDGEGDAWLRHLSDGPVDSVLLGRTYVPALPGVKLPEDASRTGSPKFSAHSGVVPSPHRDAPSTEPSAPTQGPKGRRSPLVTITNLQKALKKFQSTMAAGVPPTDLELTRGVQIARVYDFYDSASGKRRVRKMFDDVLHHRTARVAGSSVESAVMPGGSSRSSSEGSSGVAPSESACLDSPWISEGRRKKRPQQWRTATDQEQVTKWAIIVGQLLHTRMLEFPLLGDVKLVRRRLCGAATDMKKTVTCSIVKRAWLIIKAGEKLARQVEGQQQDTLDSEWEAKPQQLLVSLVGEEYIDTLVQLANATRKIVAAQPVLAEVAPPCKIFGDIHGQLRDLLLLFAVFGAPTAGHGQPVYVFNGDFVDRGNHSLAVVALLFALKVAMPDKVILIRGNHEDRSMNEKYGFREECIGTLGPHFGSMVYESVHKAFDQLPLACLIAERILILHGGIGDGAWTLGDLRSVRRPLGSDDLNDPVNKWIFNILWSDPIEDDDERLQGVFGVHPSPRGHTASQFAWDVTRTFCARNGVSLIVRSHQSKQHSLGFSIMHDNMLIRIFSARDYEGHGNDGAILLIQETHAGDALTVRPQVLRSVTKAMDEEVLHRLAASKAGLVHDLSARESLALERTSKRRTAIFKPRSKATGPQGSESAESRVRSEGHDAQPPNHDQDLSDDALEEPEKHILKSKLWTLRKDRDRYDKEAWILRELWMSSTGAFEYHSRKTECAVIVYTKGDVGRSGIERVPDDDSSMPHTFCVWVVNSNGTKEAVRYFAATSTQMREAWISQFRKCARRS